MPSSARPGSARLAVTAALATCALALTPLVATTAATAAVRPAAIVAGPIEYSADDAALSLSPLGSFETGVFNKSAAEIVTPYRDRLFVVNAQAGAVDVLNYADPTAITKQFTLSAPGIANSVAVRADGLGVVALEAPVKTDPGTLVFFDANAVDAASAVLGTVTVGALPDMVTISKNGAYAVVANEGEPAENFLIDPEGSVAVVALPATLDAPAQEAVRIADFHAFEGGALPADVRVFGPTPHGDDLPVSRNLEPEYVTIVGDTAYVALQEANAFAVVDVASATVTDILPLGFKDHGAAGNGLDASDSDPKGASTINIATYPGLKGMYMPDGIASYEAAGETYLVSANEGDAREWGGYEEGARVKDLGKKELAPVCADSPLAGSLTDDKLGRLNVTTELGIEPGADCYNELYSFGARSFSIWSTDGEQVFDSGDAFEKITAAAAPQFFNSNHSESNLEGRSDDKGPEPESVVIGTLSDRTYAFIGFERVGGIAVFDITDPAASTFVTYINNRDFSVSGAGGGDLGPEGLAFIPAESSPTGEPLLAVGNEVSGTTTVFAITDALAPAPTTDIQVLTINDFHGRIEPNFGNGEAGAAVLAGAVAQLETENPNTLFVSAGDNIGASTFTSFVQQDNPTIDALVASGLDLGAVGNHEFDAGFADLTDRVTPRFGGSKYSLGANVYKKGTTDPALDEYYVEEIDGVRVAFIGTVTQDTAAMVTPSGIANVEFGDQLEAANRVAAELTEADAADVIVLLSHTGPATPGCDAVANDTSKFGALARGASSEIDAIVTGHTHQSFTCEVAGPDGTLRPVIQAHQYGTTLGKLDISVATDTNELVSITPSLVPLVVNKAAAFPADPEVEKIVADAKAVADVEGAVQVGAISADILRGGTNGSDRGVESSLGNTVADLYLWATSNDTYAGTPAQIGLMNPGGLRADLLFGTDGTMTVRDVASVQPFANTLVTVTLTGAQLKAVLEEQWQPDGSERPKLHLGVSDGFSYTYDAAAARGSRIVSMTFEGTAISPTDSYTVVTNSFVAAGGDNFTTFAAGTDRTDTGQVDLAATVAYFASRDVVDPAEMGRASVAVPVGPTDPPVEPSNPPAGPADPPVAETGGWATVDLGKGRVEQGGSLAVTVTGLKPGQKIGATLFSDPIVVQGIPAANASGTASFQVRVPANFATGAHTLVITSEGLPPISSPVTVVRAGSLAVTGSELPLGLGLLAALLLVSGGVLYAVRRRPAGTHA